MPNVSSLNQCSQNIATMIKYFLTFYDREIQTSGVTFIGPLIIENEKQEEIANCSFCQLLRLSCKDFEFVGDWSNSVVTYERWWNLQNYKKQSSRSNKFLSLLLLYSPADGNPFF